MHRRLRFRRYVLFRPPAHEPMNGARDGIVEPKTQTAWRTGLLKRETIVTDTVVGAQ